MQDFSISPREMAQSFWRNRSLIRSLVIREVVGRYRGTTLGILWSFLHPLLMLAVYTFVFGVVFSSRWSPKSESTIEFALVLFIGLIVFNVFAESVNRAPGLILANINYVKKVVFPLEVLPWVSIGTTLFHTFVSLVVWLFAYLVLVGLPQLTIVMLPLVILPIILFTLGVSWFLASIGVFIRDVAQFTGIVTTVLMFLSPIFFPATAVPEQYRELLFISPLTPAIELARSVLYWGTMPDWVLLGRYYLGTVAAAWLGFAWFQKTRRGFADVV